jgi:hypothetical protein
VSVARIGSCAGVALGAGDSASSVVVGFEEDLDFRGEDEEGFRRVYLVVMRVCDGLERAKGGEMGGWTNCGGSCLEEEGGLGEPCLGFVKVRHGELMLVCVLSCLLL